MKPSIKQKCTVHVEVDTNDIIRLRLPKGQVVGDLAKYIVAPAKSQLTNTSSTFRVFDTPPAVVRFKQALCTKEGI